MNRAISSILIPLLLLSQSLFSVPHSHAGSSIVEPDGHDSRPHVHLHDTDQHGDHESGSETQSSSEQLPDHDSDAIYGGDDQILDDSNTAKVTKSELTVLYFVGDILPANSTLGTPRLCTQLTLPPLVRPKCALFLQFLSIRC
ncbi:MAG: hypothetical protein KDB27_05320 [Planctomycetales bacterium]|nr:hypothetical protein [Planctomycetales bacterium]